MKFEAPVIEVINFAVEDVITTSAPDAGENGMGWG